ncbi:MAG TPA: hypothetical protein VLG76_01755, partial [Rhabdochlamydiaceae bacterium]|nr:hypothetical protein [Rhabdochlamydiaceae bacterium]
MLEMTTFRKNKIVLSDYDYLRDIENRLLMSQFSALDLEVLEEILYSSLTISLKNLAKSLDLDKQQLLLILQKLETSGLLTVNEDLIIVDKEMRKYYEFQILKFDEDFKPGVEFFLGLLRKVPIQVLPSWYSIPRTSNNIFDSLIEKYFLTPQIFYRYLMELNFSEPVYNQIIQDLFNSETYEVPSKFLIEKYHLERRQFDEIILQLEFSFVCCLGYKKIDGLVQEIVSPFYEWRQYLLFLKGAMAPSISDKENIIRKNQSDFGFIENLSFFLNEARKQPLMLKKTKPGRFVLAKPFPNISEEETHIALSKLSQLKLGDPVSGRFYALDSANDWLDMKPENRALFVYRHPLNRFEKEGLSGDLFSERCLREAEKSISRVASAGWIYFDEFMSGTTCCLNDTQAVMLKRTGKSWKYSLPSYSDEEKLFLKTVIFDYLFEVGITAVGTHQGKDCFCVT